MHLQVYIDTSVYLRLLATQPQLTSGMSKFLALCENASLNLFLPQQTEQEYLSNREDVVARTIKELRNAASVGGFPTIAQNHEIGNELASLRRELAAKVKTVERWYSDAARANELPFDLWFEQLRSAATCVESEPDVLTKAQHRAAMHLPPGKGEALGDRLIWECLLKGGGFLEDLHLITGDNNDFRCPLREDEVRSRLREEWVDVNWARVKLYASIDEFLESAGKTPEFQNAADLGRAVWVLKNQSDDDQISAASETIERFINQLSIRQAKEIAKAARAYFDRVFITEGTFDRVVGEFYRRYAKHLSNEEVIELRPVALASEELAFTLAANSNSITVTVH